MPVAEKNVQNSQTAGRVHYRPGPFTRFNLALGVVAYSLLPLLASWPAINAHRITTDGWGILAAEIILLQVALWFATVRCGSEEFPFWQGVTLVAAYMRTGWLYTDLLVGGISVVFVLVISDLIALAPKPQALYYRVLRAFYTRRLVQ